MIIQPIRQWLLDMEALLSQRNHAAGVVFVATTAFGMNALLLGIQGLAMHWPVVGQYFNQSLLLYVQYTCLLLSVFYIAVAAYCWQRRHEAEHFPKSALLLSTVILVGATLCTLLYGLKDTPLVISLVGAIALTRMWFSSRILLPGIILSACLIIVNEVLVTYDILPYAPLLSHPVMTSESVELWWLIWASVIFNIVSLFVSAQLFFVFELMECNNLQLKQLALQDGLTGLHNRAAFMEQLAQECSRQQRNQQALYLLICDVDYFKKVNDSWGHPAGDQVLIALGQLLDDISQQHFCFSARFGGEEFVLLLPQKDLPQSIAIAEQIREQFASLHFNVDGQYFNATLSIGLSEVICGDGHEALRLADENLYAAKQAGRNRVSC